MERVPRSNLQSEKPMDATFIVSGVAFKSRIDGLPLHPKVALCAEDRTLYVDKKAILKACPWAIHYDEMCTQDGVFINGERFLECEGLKEIWHETRDARLAELCMAIDGVVDHVFANY